MQTHTHKILHNFILYAHVKSKISIKLHGNLWVLGKIEN